MTRGGSRGGLSVSAIVDCDRLSCYILYGTVEQRVVDDMIWKG